MGIERSGRKVRNIKGVLVVLGIILLTAGFAKMSSDPNVFFLFPEGGARWIKIEKPYEFLAQVETREEVTFRKRFTVTTVPEDATLVVRAMRTAAVFLDGRLILPFAEDLQDWKKNRIIGLGGLLAPGEHEVRITVFNRNGPAVLLAYSRALKLSTGNDWEASTDGTVWRPAVVAGETRVTSESKKFPTTIDAFSSLLPFYALLAVCAFSLSLYLQRSSQKAVWLGRLIPGPSGLRLLLLSLWALLAVNNIMKIPLDQGFDVEAHYEYIHYVATNWRVPLAPEGWQTFQSPLYYLVSAVIYASLHPFFSQQTADHLLRIVPLICGALQVEMAYRAVRYIFPLRRDLQSWGTLIGGLLPMNLYLSQDVGNEPMSGVLSAGLVVMCLRLLRSEPESLPRRYAVSMGLILGLALLTKVTAVLLIPPVLVVMIFAASKNRRPVKTAVRGVLMLSGAALVVSGWYYLRNWIALGRPFVGGWDVSRKIVWWQNPGYRTIHDFISFGQSLLYPVYSATNGFWDSVYSTFWLDSFIGCNFCESRPPWNYGFVLSSALLGLLPTAAILIGIVRTVRRSSTDPSQQKGMVFCLSSIAIYFVALLYLYFKLPIYSTAKATYTIGLLPCYAVMCASGLDSLSRGPLSRAGINAFLSCWAVSAYLSYFVL